MVLILCASFLFRYFLDAAEQQDYLGGREEHKLIDDPRKHFRIIKGEKWYQSLPLG